MNLSLYMYAKKQSTHGILYLGKLGQRSRDKKYVLSQLSFPNERIRSSYTSFLSFLENQTKNEHQKMFSSLDYIKQVSAGQSLKHAHML